MGVDSDLQQARLGLITAIADVLRNGLGILGISAQPEKTVSFFQNLSQRAIVCRYIHSFGRNHGNKVYFS